MLGDIALRIAQKFCDRFLVLSLQIIHAEDGFFNAFKLRE